MTTLRRRIRSLSPDSHPTPDRLLAMEGMRGLAIILVFFVHYHALFCFLLVPDTLSFRLSHATWSIGHSGVELFFVISGYLIYGSVLRRRQGYISFLLRRIQRIYPVLLAVMTLYVVLSVLFPQKSKIPAAAPAAVWYLIENLLLLPGLITNTPPMITVTWSLSYEFSFYLIVPVLIAVAGLRNWPPGGRALLIAGLMAVQFQFSLVPIRMLMFLVGMLVFEAVEMGWARRISNAWEWGAALLFGVSFVGIGWSELHHQWTQRLGIMAISFFVCALCCFGRRGPIARLMSALWLRGLGNISYSYYLLHAVTLQGLSLVLSRLHPSFSPLLFWLHLPVAFVTTVFTSSVLYALVEKPYSLPEPVRRKQSHPAQSARTGSVDSGTLSGR